MHYVMSDIHGNLRRYRSVMAQIDLRPEDTLYVLGDVMDRYPDGVTILRELMAMPNAKLLLGNHDYMMLQVMDKKYPGRSRNPLEQWTALPRWFRNGGEVTKQALEALNRRNREAVLAYVRALPLFYELTVNGVSYRLIHAAPLELYEDHRDEYSSRTEFTVWYRWMPEEPSPAPDTVFIFGHTATYHFDGAADPMRIFHGDRRIGIDCGAGYPEDCARYGIPQGRLACLRLEDGAEFYSEEPG